MPSRSFTKRRVALTTTILTDGFRLLPMEARELLNVVASRLSDYREDGGVLLRRQYGLRPARSAADLLSVVGQLQELERDWKIALCMCIIGPRKVCNSVNRAVPKEALARFGVSSKTLAVIHQFRAETSVLMCAWKTASTRNGLTSHRGCDRVACYRLVVRQDDKSGPRPLKRVRRYREELGYPRGASEGEGIDKNLVNLEGDGAGRNRWRPCPKQCDVCYAPTSNSCDYLESDLLWPWLRACCLSVVFRFVASNGLSRSAQRGGMLPDRCVFPPLVCWFFLQSTYL